MGQAVITSGRCLGKGDEIYLHYLNMTSEELAMANKSTIVQKFGAEDRPLQGRSELNGSIVQVMNDTPFKCVLKIFSDCEAEDFIGPKPSVDLRFSLRPGEISMGWMVYNCDFKLMAVIEDPEHQHENEWREIKADAAELTHNVAISMLIEKQRPVRREDSIDCCNVS